MLFAQVVIPPSPPADPSRRFLFVDRSSATNSQPGSARRCRCRLAAWPRSLHEAGTRNLFDAVPVSVKRAWEKPEGPPVMVEIPVRADPLG